MSTAISPRTASRAIVTIDRDAASRVGISPLDVDNALYDAFGQRSVATIYEDINQYSVIMGWDAPTPPPARRTCPTSACPTELVAARRDRRRRAQRRDQRASRARRTAQADATARRQRAARGAATGTAATATVPTNPALRDPSTGSALSTTARTMVPLDADRRISRKAPTAATRQP